MKKIFVSVIFLFLAVAFGAMTGYNALRTGAYAASAMPDSGDPDPDGGGTGGSGGGVLF